MKRSFSMLCSILLLCVASLAQANGRILVSVESSPDAAMPGGPVAGAKVVVSHWANSQLHPSLVQDQVATTNAKGDCTIELPPGTYDIFVSASGLTPAAYQRVVQAGGNLTVYAKLKAAPTRLHPVE